MTMASQGKLIRIDDPMVVSHKDAAYARESSREIDGGMWRRVVHLTPSYALCERRVDYLTVCDADLSVAACAKYGHRWQADDESALTPVFRCDTCGEKY